MNNLQNRLDQQGTPDFDREGLWQRIERPRKRRRMLWWWLGAGSLLLLLWLGLGKDSTPPALSGFYIGNPEQEQGQRPPAAQVENPEEGILPQEKSSVMGATALQDLQSKKVQKLVPEKAKAIEKAKADRRVEVVAIRPKPGDKERKGLQRTPSPIRTTESKSAPATSGSSTATSPAVQPKKQKALKLLPTLPVALVQGSSSPSFPSRFAEIEQAKPQKNTFVLSGGLAAQLHINRTDCGWAGEEHALPGFYLRGQYQRGLGNGFYAFGAAQYTAHHSRLSARQTISTKSLNALNQEVRTSETTFYELYNQYERIEVGVGLGKTWNMKALTFALEASGGYSQWLNVDGNYLNQEGVLQTLAPAGEMPRSFVGRVDIALLKPLSERWTVGLTMQAQTPVTVSPSSMSCTHRLYPLGFGVLVGRRW
jgi:hypothetical protein